MFLVALLGVIAALAGSRRRPPVPVLLVVLVTVAFALLSQRNIELFALTALPLLALHLDSEWRALPVLRRAKAVFEQEHAGRYAGVGAATVTALLVILALAGGRVAGVTVVSNRFDERAFPVRAVREASQARLQGRIFSQFTWGGYLMHEWPEQRVFIDGGTDHYGEKLLDEYVQVWNLERGWRDVLRRWDIALVLVPPASRLAGELTRDAHWSAWYCDSAAVILRRSGAAADSSSGPRPQAASCAALGGASP